MSNSYGGARYPNYSSRGLAECGQKQYRAVRRIMSHIMVFVICYSAVSSGVPEVNDYPFTTRGVAVGHIVSEDERFQVFT